VHFAATGVAGYANQVLRGLGFFHLCGYSVGEKRGRSNNKCGPIRIARYLGFQNTTRHCNAQLGLPYSCICRNKLAVESRFQAAASSANAIGLVTKTL
jgi:hypothetical protein